MIKEYFIRLTPDRQSKRGYCWSDAAMPSDKWVTTIKFRISGQVYVSTFNNHIGRACIW